MEGSGKRKVKEEMFQLYHNLKNKKVINNKLRCSYSVGVARGKDLP